MNSNCYNLNKYFYLNNFYGNILITYKNKNRDYGNSVELTRKQFGNVSMITRLYDKFYRLSTLTYNTKTNGSGANYESISDTMLDMFVYVLIWKAILLKDKRQLPEDYKLIHIMAEILSELPQETLPFFIADSDDEGVDLATCYKYLASAQDFIDGVSTVYNSSLQRKQRHYMKYIDDFLLEITQE